MCFLYKQQPSSSHVFLCLGCLANVVDLVWKHHRAECSEIIQCFPSVSSRRSDDSHSDLFGKSMHCNLNDASLICGNWLLEKGENGFLNMNPSVLRRIPDDCVYVLSPVKEPWWKFAVMAKQIFACEIFFFFFFYKTGWGTLAWILVLKENLVVKCSLFLSWHDNIWSMVALEAVFLTSFKKSCRQQQMASQISGLRHIL